MIGMKNISGFLAILFLMPCTSPIVQAGNQSEGQRYVYCNVFAASICFGITREENSKMTIPADFVLYDVALVKGLSGIIYSGRQPQQIDLPSAGSLKEYSVPEGRITYQSSAQGGYDFFFHPSTVNLPNTHVQFPSVSKEQEDVFADFMRNIRACKLSSSGVACSDSKIFSQAMDQLGL